MKISTTAAILLCSFACLSANSITKRFHIIPTHTKKREAPTSSIVRDAQRAHRYERKKSNPLAANKKFCTKVIPHKKIDGRDEFAVTSTLPNHGEIAITGKQVLFGTNLYFDKLKQEAAIHTLPLFKFFYLDNNGQVPRARADLEELRKQSPALLNLFGTKIIVALEKQIRSNQWGSFFPVEGLDRLRTQDALNTIYLRASYEEELSILIDYTINTLNHRKIALFYEASDFGEGILAQFNKVLKTHGLTPAAVGAYPENTVNIAQAVPAIIKGAPNAIICASGTRPAYNFISQMINNGMHRCAFLGLSTLFALQKPLAQSRGVTITVSSVVPDPFRSSIPIAQEYRAAMKKYLSNKTISPSSFEAYINASLFAHAVEQTSAPITVRSVMATLESYDALNFKGLNLSFNPATRSLSHNVWLNNGDDKEWILAKPSDE